MKKTILLAAALLPGALLAQTKPSDHTLEPPSDKIQVRGYGEGCNGIGRGCLPIASAEQKKGALLFDLFLKQGNKITLSIPIPNLSEEEQIYLTGKTIGEINEDVFFFQEEDYYFSTEEKRILNCGDNTYLKKGKYPIRITNNELFIDLEISQR